VTSHHLSLFSHLASGNWAAWARAFAVTAAIVAVLWVVWLQPRAARRARQKGILAIAEAGLERAKQIGEAFAQPGPLEISAIIYVIHQQTAIDGVVQALTNVRAHGIGSRDVVIALSRLQDQFRSLIASIEILETPIKDPRALKRVLALDDAERRRYLTGLRPVLDENVRDHITTIQRDYAALARALSHGAAPDIIHREVPCK
jgi:hypothetical protein